MLTVDLGNTRLKAIRWRRSASTFEPLESFDGAGDGLDELLRWLGPERVPQAALASVAEAARTERVRASLAPRCERLLVAPESGLENRCREPDRVGQDRLYAAAGAAERFGRSCVVVDAGTALTVDALLVRGEARAFLGGAIAPGPALGASALAAGTARLPLIEPRPGAHALGTVTEDALQAGLVVGFRGAAERLVLEVAAAAGLDRPLVVLSGGAREFLLTPRPFTELPLEVVPDLVQRGLLVALLRALEPLARAAAPGEP